MTRRLGSLAALVMLATATASAGNWPQFRGPHGSGIGDGKPPDTFDVDEGDNVRWKTAVAGLGHASPVIWGDRVYLVTAVSENEDQSLKVGLYGNIEPVRDDSVHRFQLLALDRKSGKVAWTRTAHEGVPAVKRHTKASHANSTPATDGEHVVAMFGSEGLYCYDSDGELRWKKDFGTLDSGYFAVPAAQWGFGSSPVIHDDIVIIQADVQKGSFLAAFQLEDGEPIWRTERDEVPTWSTPAVYTGDAGAQVIVNGFKHIGGYDLKTGKPVWWMKGGGDIPVPTPILGDGLVYITNAHGGMSPVYAVKLGAEGDITLAKKSTDSEHVAWSHKRYGAYMQTPLLLDDLLYVCRDNGVLSVYHADSGKLAYRKRVASGHGFTASLVTAGGQVYATAETGAVFVFRAGEAYEQLAENDLGEVAMATPAIADGAIYFRTRGHLVAVGE